MVAPVTTLEPPDETDRASLIAIVDPGDEQVHRALREELTEWYVIACTVGDLDAVVRAFRVGFVLIVGGAQLVAEAFTELERIGYAPERFAVVPDVTRARRAIGPHGSGGARVERSWRGRLTTRGRLASEVEVGDRARRGARLEARIGLGRVAAL
jgi:hypothetical protein